MPDTLLLDEWLELPVPRNGEALVEAITEAVSARDVLGSIVGLLGDDARGQIGWVDGASVADRRWARNRIRAAVAAHDPNTKTADELEDEAEAEFLAELAEDADPRIARLARIVQRQRVKRQVAREANPRRKPGRR